MKRAVMICCLSVMIAGNAMARDDEVAPAANIRLPAERPATNNVPQEQIEAPAPNIGLPLPPEPAPAPEPPAATPSPAMPMQPSADVIPATPANQDIPLPPLPVSRPCMARDITGVWRLLEVYEKPASTEQAAFARARFQYMQFLPDNVLTTYASPNNDLTLEQIQARLNTQDNNNLQQYVYKDVQGVGYLYFYSKSVATNNMVCFIVTTAKPPFAAGQMLFMPPKEQSVGRRLVKVYERALLPGAVAPDVTPPKPGRHRRGRPVPPPPAVTAPVLTNP